MKRHIKNKRPKLHLKKRMLDSKIPLTRSWLPNLSTIPIKTAIPISVLSYNLLASCNIEHTSENYKNPEHLLWSKRLPMLQKYFLYF